jgi:hypothetical protein
MKATEVNEGFLDKLTGMFGKSALSENELRDYYATHIS